MCLSYAKRRIHSSGGEPPEKRRERMAETLVYASRIKELAKKYDMRMSGDSPDALNAKIEAMVEAAAKRAKENKRKTIMPFDF